MAFFDYTLYISVFVSMFVTMLVYIYITMYDKENKRNRNTFCLKVFMLTFATTYMATHITLDKGDNPIDHMYTCDPDF